MLADKVNEPWKIKLKTKNSVALPYNQGAFSPLDPTTSWLLQLALAIYMVVVVNFDALAQENDIQIERSLPLLIAGLEPRLFVTESPADWMPADKLTEPWNVILKTWTQQTVPIINEYSAHPTPLPVGLGTWLWRYACLLLSISMLWQWQAIFESKGNKLSFSVECMITQGFWNQISRRLNTQWQTDWAIEDQAKNLNSIARPYHQQTWSPLDPTASWLLHLALAT